jgi:hypothetical protein
VLTIIFYYKIYSDNPKTILYVDDARVIINKSNFNDSVKVIDMVFKMLINSFLTICFL